MSGFGDAASETGTGSAGGPVAISGVANARQTGGLPTSAGFVRQNVILRSGHLGSVDATGCEQFKALGVRTIIDLREAADAAATPDAACTTSTATYYLADLPKILPPTEASYQQTLAAAEPKLKEIFTRLSNPGALPAVLHCVIGRDRSCIVTALVLLAVGVPAEAVVTDFTVNQDASIQVDGAWIQAVIAEVDKRGGIDAYLTGLGVTAAQIEQLKQMAVQG